MARLIYHTDVNSPFLSWEATHRFSLGKEDIRLIPSAIGADRDNRTGFNLDKTLAAIPRGGQESNLICKI